MKRAIIITLLCLHLIFIFLGTSLVDFAWVPEAIRPPISLHLSLTGGHSYAFFSPEIPKQIIVSCRTIDSSGLAYTDSFGAVSDTRDLRTNYLFQLLNNENENEAAARIAADICFKKYPHASFVQIAISRVIVPTVQAYKQGQRNTLAELYSETFYHRSATL